MVQFVIMISHAAYLLFFSNGECPYPKLVTQVYFYYILSMLALFMNFYLRKHGGSGEGKAGKSSKAD